jgi:hypothetical protein
VAKLISSVNSAISSVFRTVFAFDQTDLSLGVAFEVLEEGDKTLSWSLAPLVKIAVILLSKICCGQNRDLQQWSVVVTNLHSHWQDVASILQAGSHNEGNEKVKRVFQRSAPWLHLLLHQAFFYVEHAHAPSNRVTSFCRHAATTSHFFPLRDSLS